MYTAMEKRLAKVALALVVGTLVSGALTGCAGPLLLGAKEMTFADGTHVGFITGADFGFSVNGTDTVDNRRGITATGSGLKMIKGQ